MFEPSTYSPFTNDPSTCNPLPFNPPTHDNSSCSVARYDPSNAPTNADVDGIAVSVANIVVHLCLRILVTWFPDDIDEGIQAILLQIYPVLLSTLFSIGRNQLSLFDANFALIITSSPLTVYLAVASICHWFRIEVGLYKRVRSYRLVTRALGALVLFLWFGLSAIARLSDRAFIDSGLCEGSTIEEWLWDFFWFATYSVGYPGFPSIPGSTTLLYVPIFILFWDLILEIKEGWSSFKRRSTLRKWFRIPWISVRWAWHRINHNHKWYIHLLLVYLDAGWAYRVINNATIASKGYVLSYGQVLSVFAAIPPVVSTVKFVYSSRQGLFRFVRRLPWLCVVEVMYLVTSIKLPPHAQGNHPSGSTSQEASHEALPEESQQPEEPTPDIPDSLAHPGSQRDCPIPRCDQSPISLVADLPLADIILANRGDTTTTEPVEPICDLHGPSPLNRESVVQVVAEDVPPVREQQGDMEVNETSQSSALTNVTSTNTAFPSARRAWTHG